MPMLRCCALVTIALMAAAAADAGTMEFLRTRRVAATGGVAWVGPDQYDEGKARGIFTASADGLWNATPSVSFGGIGLGFRASNGVYWDFSEVGILFPFATYRRGLWTMQTGMLIQRANFRKHAYYVGTGISLPKRAYKQ